MNLKIVVQDGGKKIDFLVEVLQKKKLSANLNLAPKSPQKCLVISDDKIKHNQFKRNPENIGQNKTLQSVVLIIEIVD